MAHEEPRESESTASRSVVDLFESLPFQAVLLGRSGDILRWNAAWEEFARQNGAATPPSARNYLDVCTDAPGDAGTAAELIRSVLEGQTDRAEFEYPCHSPDRARWFRMVCVALGDELVPSQARSLARAGRDAVALVIHVDVTSLRQREELLRSFATAFAHDARGPLHRLGGFASLLRDAVEEGDRAMAEECLQAIERAVGATCSQIDSLVELARAEEEVLKREPVDLDELCRELIASLQLQYSLDDARFHLERLPVVVTDRAVMQHVLRNLLENAIKYRRNDRPLEVVVQHEETECSWAVSLSDNGVGVPEASRARVFDPFVRLADDRLSKGSGLGLTLCSRLLRPLGASIVLDESRQGGARFVVNVPRDATTSDRWCAPAGRSATAAPRGATPARAIGT